MTWGSIWYFACDNADAVLAAENGIVFILYQVEMRHEKLNELMKQLDVASGQQGLYCLDSYISLHTVMLAFRDSPSISATYEDMENQCAVWWPTVCLQE